MNPANVDIRKLHHALILQEVGGFTAAAARLNLTQSALSRSIQTLEDSVKLTLFDRGRNGASVTPAGREFLGRAREVYGSLLDLQRYAADLSSGSGGAVTLGLGPSVAHAVLPRVIDCIVRDHPKLSLTVKCEPVPALIERLIDGGCDVVFVADTHAIDTSRVSERSVMTATAGLLVRKGHPLSGIRRVTAADLNAFTLVSGPVESEEIRSIYGRDCRIIVCDNLSLLRDLVMTTDAIWLTLTLVAAHELRNGAMEPLVLSNSRPRHRFTISRLTMKQSRLSKSAEIVSSEIEATLRQLATTGRAWDDHKPAAEGGEGC